MPGRNADMDPRARLIGEIVDLGRGLVAECGAGPHAQDRGPEASPALAGSPVKVA